MPTGTQQQVSYTFTPPSDFKSLMLELVELILDSSETPEALPLPETASSPCENANL